MRCMSISHDVQTSHKISYLSETFSRSSAGGLSVIEGDQTSWATSCWYADHSGHDHCGWAACAVSHLQNAVCSSSPRPEIEVSPTSPCPELTNCVALTSQNDDYAGPERAIGDGRAFVGPVACGGMRQMAIWHPGPTISRAAGPGLVLSGLSMSGWSVARAVRECENYRRESMEYARLCLLILYILYMSPSGATQRL
ncbi:hypothetical protein BV20DRAFT_776324 [Pilatotrama ljubarskyi]|nr:hypothetical protein BV20DRAFT_776324 [Pilatotrama ljubarskyi]